MDPQRNPPPFGTHRPAFTVGPESASSVSRSSSSLSTMSSAAVPIAGASSQSQQPQNSSAPIPPSSPVQQTHFMGSIPAATAAPPPARQLQFPPQQSQAPATARPGGWDYNPNREGAGRTAQETAAFLNEYSLVAEAAKRAQMAVLMRDMEAVELS
ncbi:hypothetical protein IWX49DRAFT_230221 [Phyllosticta citricarpa]|uniref:Uncharacterized protein n=2 Tax=Phyllosticta TaxID=121621 RepID=A0ABR1LVM2_9PEZI